MKVDRGNITIHTEELTEAYIEENKNEISGIYVSLDVYVEVLDIVDFPHLISLDRYGPGAFAGRDEAGKVFGIPIYVEETFKGKEWAI